MAKTFDIYSNYNEYYKNFLGGWSFENGDETLTIIDVTQEEMYDVQTGGKKRGACLHFKEKELPMVLNKTNADMVALVTGSSIFKDWIGKRIVVGQSKVRSFGKETVAIRVRKEYPEEHVERLTGEQYNTIKELIENGTITNEKAMLDYFKVSKLKDLSREDAAQLIKQKTGEVTF